MTNWRNFSPYMPGDEERVLESIANSINGSILTVDDALSLVDWAAHLSLEGFSVADIQKHFEEGIKRD